MPLIDAALSSRGQGIAGSEPFVPFSIQTDRRMMSLMTVFIQKGVSLEEKWLGYTPVQAAILFGDLDAVKLFVDHGADLNARLDKPGSKADKMNALEFAELLSVGRFPEWHKSTVEYLRRLESGQ